MSQQITLIDRGRGLQLSTSRITVMDLVQYFRHGWSYDQIMENIPSLTAEEIAVVESYYREHKEELDEEDQRVVEYREEQIRLQRLRFPVVDETPEEFRARLRERLRLQREGKNGDRNSP